MQHQFSVIILSIFSVSGNYLTKLKYAIKMFLIIYSVTYSKWKWFWWWNSLLVKTNCKLNENTFISDFCFVDSCFLSSFIKTEFAPLTDQKKNRYPAQKNTVLID